VVRQKGGCILRTVVRILIVLSIILVAGIYTNKQVENNEILKNPANEKTPQANLEEKLKQQDGTAVSERPERGISAHIGQSSNVLIQAYGQPDRKDPSAHGYDWWIYNMETAYLQFGVEQNKVVTAYAIGEADVAPFTIGQSVDEIFRSTFIDTEVLVEYEGSTYRFELSEEDLNVRPLVPLGNIYAQLYLDKFTGTLSSIRFISSKHLIIQSPYEMVYSGELLSAPEHSAEDWMKIHEGEEKQILDITNIIRKNFDLNEVEWDSSVAQIAKEHSKEMYDKEYFSQESPSSGNLGDRLKGADISFVIAGENIAEQYIDGPAVVEGWLNSERHRRTLLEPDFTHLGVGVYRNYYTQDFIQKEE